MRRQRLAPGTARRRLGLGRRLSSGSSSFFAQPFELRLQARFVLSQRLFEQAALLGAHRLGLGAELPALEPRELEVDLLQLGIAPGDVAVLALDELLPALELISLVLDVLEHLCGQCRDGLGRQTVQVLSLESRMPSMRCMTPISATAHHWQMSCQSAAHRCLPDGSGAHVREIKPA